jgi:hypothetical protein
VNELSEIGDDGGSEHNANRKARKN